MLKTEIKDAKAFVDSLNPKPDVLLAVTNDANLTLNWLKRQNLMDAWFTLLIIQR